MKRYLLILAVLISATKVAFCQALEELGTKLDIRSVAINGKNIFIGTWGNGLYFSPDSGSAWQPSNNGLPEEAKISKIIYIGKNILAFEQDQGIYLSTNNGIKWNNIQTFGKAKGLEKFKDRAYVASEKGLFVSDNGLGWTNANLAKTPIYNLCANANFIVIGQKNASFEYFSSSDGETWKLTSGLTKNEAASLEQHGNFITSLKYKTANAKSTQGTLSKNVEVFILNESGKKWDKISVPMTRYYDFDKNNIYSISAYLDQTKDSKYIFHTEVLLSTDKGKKWKKIQISDPMITSNLVLRYKLIQFEKEAEHEIAIAQADKENTEKMNQEWIELRKKLREWTQNLSANNYEQLSNDRFDEIKSYKESWIDSQGKIHIQ